MRFASTGLRARWRSVRSSEGRSGFTLLEALVSLTIVAVFAAVLAHFLLQARSVMAGAETRVAAYNLLRSLVDDPLLRPSLASPWREGEAGGLRWRLVAQPIAFNLPVAAERPKWLPFRVTATVLWGANANQAVTAETVRLGTAE
jgi:prepilin-type N-terminal cleavage/methylation domain-containing protein